METGDTQIPPPSSAARHRPSPSPKHFAANEPSVAVNAAIRDEANIYAEQLPVSTRKITANGPNNDMATLSARSPFSTRERVSPVHARPSSSAATPLSRSPENNKTILVTRIRSTSPSSAEQHQMRRISTLPGPLQVSPPGSTLHSPYTRAQTTVDPARLTSPHRHAATLPASMVTTRSKSPRVRREKKEKKIGHRRVDRNTGQVSYKRFPTNELMGALQEGIRHSISQLSSQQNTVRDVLYQDFAVVENVFHPSSGSATTQPHPYADFRFKTYAPVAFRYFRNLFDIKTDDFLSAICDKPLIEITNPGASGSIFYITDDGLFILKTVQAKEAEFLQRLLAGYFLNLSQNPRTLLPKFFGIYCYQSLGKNVRILAMNNIFPREVKMHEKYDLKGSTFGRKASKKERAKSCPTYKDLDFLEFHSNGIILEPEIYEQVMKTIRRDCAVLESFKIMDYSLLIGIHNMDEAARQATLEADENTKPEGGVDAKQASLQAQQAAAASNNEAVELFSSVKYFKREPSSPDTPLVAATSTSSRPREAKLTRHQSVHRQRMAAFPNERSSMDETPLSISGKPSGSAMKAGGASIPEADNEVDAGDDEDGDYETDESLSGSENEVDVEGAGENSDDDVEPVNAADYPDAIEGRNENGDRLVLFMAIIDILQNYRLRKQLEHSFKAILYDGKTVSVCHPTFYAQRFQDFMADRVFKAHSQTAPASPTRSASPLAESVAVSEAHVNLNVEDENVKEHRRSLGELLGDVPYTMPGTDETGVQPPHVADAEAAAHAAELAAHAAQKAAEVTQQPAHAEVATAASTQQIFLPAGQQVMHRQQPQQDTGSSSGYYSSLRSNTASTNSERNKPKPTAVTTTTKAVGQATAEPSLNHQRTGRPEDLPVHDVVGHAATTTTVNNYPGQLDRQVSSSRDALRKQKHDFFTSKPNQSVGQQADSGVLNSQVSVQSASAQPTSRNVQLDVRESAENNGSPTADSTTSSSSSGISDSLDDERSRTEKAKQGQGRMSSRAQDTAPAKYGASDAGYARLASSPLHNTDRNHVTTVTVNAAPAAVFPHEKKKDQVSSFSVSSSAAAAAVENRSANRKPIVYPDASPLYVRKDFSKPSNTVQTTFNTTHSIRGDNIVTVFSNGANVEQQWESGLKKMLPHEREQTASAAVNARLVAEMGDGKKR